MAGDGMEYSFTPSFRRIASLGAPHEIVELYAALHGPKAETEAAYVLAGLCDQDDPTPLIGGIDLGPKDSSAPPRIIEGEMPPAERVIIARHLMQHGIVGRARPGAGDGDGRYSDRFDASEFVAAARVHLGLSSADAEALSMTEFQVMFEMKFPDAKKAQRDFPTLEEYEVAMAAFDERQSQAEVNRG